MLANDVDLFSEKRTVKSGDLGASRRFDWGLTDA